MLRLICIGVMATLIAACQSTSASAPEPEAYSYSPIRFAGAKATPAERMQCEAVGGVVGEGGILRNDICYQTMPDAGKVCSNNSDCVFLCLSVEDVEVGQKTIGQCSAVDSSFGCHGRVEDGRLKYRLCED